MESFFFQNLDAACNTIGLQGVLNMLGNSTIIFSDFLNIDTPLFHFFKPSLVHMVIIK